MYAIQLLARTAERFGCTPKGEYPLSVGGGAQIIRLMADWGTTKGAGYLLLTQTEDQAKALVDQLGATPAALAAELVKVRGEADAARSALAALQAETQKGGKLATR